MAKFNMKDYEDFMEEEKRQDQLQEKLDYRNREGAYDAEENWRDWQREQREEEYRQKQEDCDFEYDWDYDPLDDDDCDDDDCDDDDLADDLYNSYSEFYTEDIVSEWRIANKSDERNQQEDRICRKAVARNRHHAAEKAKRKAKKSARNLERRYWKADYRLPYEEYRLATRARVAIKKANRFKVKNA